MFMASDANTSDPRKLLITTPGVANLNDSEQTLASAAPGGVVRNIPSHDFLKELLDATRRQVQDNGTLKVLVVKAHGDSLTMHAAGQNSSDPTTETSLQDFLKGIGNLQNELGQKVTDKIVLISCNVMTDLNSGDVKLLRATAKTLGTDIVGATSTHFGGDAQSGRMVRFGSDGSVSRDPLTKTGLRYYEAAFGMWISSKDSEHNSDTWASCHIGQTQEAGAACQAETTVRTYRDAEFSKQLVQTGAESIYVPRAMPDKLKLSSLGALGWYSIIDRLDNHGETENGRKTLTALAMSNYKGANNFYDAAAVEAHAKFIDGLSPEGRQLAEKYVDEYRQQHPPVPQARFDSRDTKQLKTTEAAATSTPVANVNEATSLASSNSSTAFQRGAHL
jgi:hypothetical protein